MAKMTRIFVNKVFVFDEQGNVRADLSDEAVLAVAARHQLKRDGDGYHFTRAMMEEAETKDGQQLFTLKAVVVWYWKELTEEQENLLQDNAVMLNAKLGPMPMVSNEAVLAVAVRHQIKRNGDGNYSFTAEMLEQAKAFERQLGSRR